MTAFEWVHPCVHVADGIIVHLLHCSRHPSIPYMAEKSNPMNLLCCPGRMNNGAQSACQLCICSTGWTRPPDLTLPFLHNGHICVEWNMYEHSERPTSRFQLMDLTQRASKRRTKQCDKNGQENEPLVAFYSTQRHSGGDHAFRCICYIWTLMVKLPVKL